MESRGRQVRAGFGAAKLLSKDEAWRIAANIAKLSNLWESHKTSWIGTKRAARRHVQQLPQGFIVHADDLFIDDARQFASPL
jgi:hypothetical protein